VCGEHGKPLPEVSLEPCAEQSAIFHALGVFDGELAVKLGRNITVEENLDIRIR
jgi:hypothetical protein